MLDLISWRGCVYKGEKLTCSRAMFLGPESTKRNIDVTGCTYVSMKSWDVGILQYDVKESSVSMVSVVEVHQDRWDWI
jgi:hypothetical protein